MSQPDSNALPADIGTVRPRLRPELRPASRHFGSERWFTLEDPVTDRFYRLGEAEFRFAERLRGDVTLAEALAESNAAPDATGKTLTGQEALIVYQWLADCGLTVSTNVEDVKNLELAAERASRAVRVQRVNPLMVRIPLFDPNRFLARVYPWLGWVTSPLFFVVWLSAVIYAGYLVISEWTPIRAALSQVVAPNNWVWLLLAWLGLKLVHELMHGLAVKRFGGHCREAGVFLILFIPLAYVDVSSVWRFSSRWPRVAVAAAGMYVELFIAAVSLSIWSVSEPGLVRSIAYDTALVASIGSLLFNANFLMRFDGYHIVSDALGIPNLYVHGQRYVSYLINRFAFGAPAALPQVPGGRSWLVRSYGVAAGLWRITVLAALLIAASMLLEGAGIILAVLAAGLWFGPPIVAWIKRFRASETGQPPLSVRRGATRMAILAAVGYGLWNAPVPKYVVIPGTVAYQDVHEVRAGTAGFVADILVSPGENVRLGTPLIKLRNDELVTHAATLRLEILANEIKARRFREQKALGELRTVLKRIEILKEEAASLDAEVDELTIIAARDGTFLSPDLSTSLGQYLPVGQSIGVIADEGAKEVVLSAQPEDLPDDVVGAQIAFQAGQELTPDIAEISRVAPTASRNVEFAALSAANGGPIPVTLSSGDNKEAKERTGGEYTQPRLQLVASLSRDQSIRQYEGSPVSARLAGRERTIGEELYASWQRWRAELRG